MPKYDYPALYSFMHNTHHIVQQMQEHQNWGLDATQAHLSNTVQREQTHLLNQLQSIHLDDQPDKTEWRWNSKLIFTIKSAYKFIKCQASTKQDIAIVWKIHVPPKAQIFIWLALKK
jgi:zinc-binding in reverse transcriptase